METLRDKNLVGATIIERRQTVLEIDDDGREPYRVVEGVIGYADVNGDGSLGVGWRDSHGGNRTTLFLPSSWAATQHGGTIALYRISPDNGHADVPPAAADWYTITLRR